MPAPHTSGPRVESVHTDTDHGGLLFHLLSRSRRWREVIHEMARHLPPSGAALSVLVVNSRGPIAPFLLEKRPDLSITSFDLHPYNSVEAIPFADDSFDAVLAQNVLNFAASRESILREAFRVLRPGGRLILLHPAPDRPTRKWVKLLTPEGLSILYWDLSTSTEARVALEKSSEVLQQQNFDRVLSERVLDGYGILSRGEKPYTHLSTVERVALTATRDQGEGEAQIVDAEKLEAASRGRFIYVLVRQTPDKPAWAIQPDEALRWQAAMISDEEKGGKPLLLAFTSLPKAVAFMQSAVTSGALHGINKVAKFDKAVAVEWATDLFLNPSFDALHTSEQYAFKGVQLDVEPRRAVSGEE